MVDTTFLSSVVVRLLGSTDHATGNWAGLVDLHSLVRTELADDPVGRRALGAVRTGRPTPGQVLDLLGAVRGRAEEDPLFLEELRRLVVAAYADPAVFPLLPDPSPGL